MAKKIDPEIAEKVMLRAGLKPLEVYKDSKSKWKCKCLKCGKIVEPTLKQIKTGSKCAYCAGNRIDPKDAISKMISAGLKPLEPYKGAGSKWKCIHKKCKKIVSLNFTY